MNYGPELLLVGAVATVGVLHTMVPDHWVPITLIARQRGWSKSETALAALQAGIGHVLSTLLIALVVWLAGAAFAQRFGHIVDTVSSLALIPEVFQPFDLQMLKNVPGNTPSRSSSRREAYVPQTA